MVRVAISDACEEKTDNRDFEFEDYKGKSTACIASDCMAWREKTKAELPRVSTGCRDKEGYCGLAGKP
jgi:hypothetical protein